MADDIVDRLRYGDNTLTAAEVIAEIERLRAERDAIEALHQPQEGLDEYMRPEQWCPACANYWPCPTYLLLHPEEERREQ